MPRIPGVNITAMVRRELLNGTPDDEIIRRARELSPNPHVWGEASLRQIRRQMAGRGQRRQVRSGALLVGDRIDGVTNRQVRSMVRAAQNTINTSDFDTTQSFGIEIEFLRPIGISQAEIARRITSAGVNCSSESYNHTNHRSHWKIVTDASVNSHNSTHHGSNEIVSPILKGEDGMNQLKIVCQILNEVGVKVNKTCGLHIHHNCSDLNGRRLPQVAINALVIYKKYQAKFNNMMPRSRRNAYYARAIESRQIRHIRNGGNLERSTSTRYRTVNIHSFYRHGTLEFRQHGGTASFKKISNWIKITQRIMARARHLADNNMDIWHHNFGRFSNELSFSSELNTYYRERVASLNQPVAEAA